jgi:myo-inositol-1(or 4)-monophosphatase
MKSLVRSELLLGAEQVARAGAAVVKRYFASADLDVRLKDGNDFVTRADRESEDAIVAEILERFPSHAILGEEGGHLGTPGGDYQWLVDPLDGTTNFLRGVPVFAVSVAVRSGNDLLAGVVLDPMGDQLFAAEKGAGATLNGRPITVTERPEGLDGSFLATGYPHRARAALDRYLDLFRDVFHSARGIRRCGAAALDLAYTAAGTYDGFFEFRLAPWDIAAGALLVEEAGGIVTDLDGGSRFLESGNVLAGGSRVHSDLLRSAGVHVSEGELDRLVPQPAWIGEM